MSAIRNEAAPGRRSSTAAAICLTQFCLAIAAGALLCIVAINGANVVARYLFGTPFSWAEELMLFLMILSVFSGAIAITWRNLHIRIDTFVDACLAARAASRAGDRRARLDRRDPHHRVRQRHASSALLQTLRPAQRCAGRCRPGSRSPSSPSGWR